MKISKHKLAHKKTKIKLAVSDLLIKLDNETYIRKLAESKVQDLEVQIGIIKSEYRELEENSLLIIEAE